MRPLLVFALALTLSACGDASGDGALGNSTSSAAVAGGGASGGSGRTYDESIRDTPCDLLTPALAAEALGVAESDLVSKRVVMKSCSYDVTGSDKTVYLRVSTVRDDEESAASMFSGMYRVMTEAELEQVRETANAQMEERVASGEVDADIADGLDAGNMLAGAASKMNYIAADVGDQSVISRTSQLFDGVHVRDGNLLFTVLADVSAAYLDPRNVTDEMVAEAEKNVEPSLALARAIIAAQ